MGRPGVPPSVGLVLSRLLRLLPPEAAHAAALRGLRLGLYPAAPGDAARRPRLVTELWGHGVANPIGLAAGFDKNAEAVDALFALGFGAVEVGTVTPRPQAGNPRPRLFRLPEDGALINRLGFNNQGLDPVRARLAARNERRGLLGANIGMNRDASDPIADYTAVLRGLYSLVDYITVNVSSPNTPGLRGLQSRDRLEELLRALLQARADLGGPVAKPLLVKIAPDLEPAEEEAIAEVALALGIDGLIVGNTTVARPAGLRGRHRGEAGGLSGRPLFARSTELLRRMYRLTGGGDRGPAPGRPVLFAAGGVASGADAYAKIRAGASLVQLYTAMIYRGPGIVRRICAELDALLERDGFGTVGEAVGADGGGAEPR